MTLSAVFFVSLAALCWGAGAFFDKLSLRYTDSSSAFFMRTLFMWLGFVPLLALNWDFTRGALSSAGRSAGPWVLASVVVTMGGVYFYFKALGAAEASRVVPLSSSYPLFAFLLAYLFLGESFTMNKLFGTLLISGGIYLVSK